MMTDYSTNTCEACSVDAPKVSDKELSEFLFKNSEWSLSNDVDFKQLKAVFLFKDFVTAQSFVSIIGKLAEEEGHHPSILLEFGKVTVRWWSHKIINLHINDLIMATKTKQLYDNFVTS